MKTIYLLCLALLLTACSPAQPAPVQPDVIGTAAAAEVSLERARLAMTATEAARIAPITAQAIQIQIQQTAQAATSTAAYVEQVASWTPTPNYTAIVASAEASAAVEKIKRDDELGRLELDRARKMNTVYAMLPAVVAICALIIGVAFGVGVAKKVSAIPLPVNSKGEPYPIIVDGKLNDVPQQAGSPVPQLSAQKTADTAPALPAPVSANAENTENLFRLPAWDLLNSWDGDRGIPYGTTAKGLQFVSIETHPHIATIGKTGSGKSRWFLRPFLAGALAAGHRVVVMGKSADFNVFNGHPNSSLVTVRDFTNDNEAARYAEYLRGLIEEMNRRDEYLTQHNHSTWQQAGRESTFIVLDELGNALDMMPRDTREQTLRYVKGLANEGRKVGFNLVMASQRAVGFRNIITQVGRAVFFVEDEQESRFAMGMPGAENLRPGYFFARFGSVQMTGAFQPSDAQISAFLAARSVKPLAPINWLDMAAAPQIIEPNDDQRIRELYAAGKSLTEIQNIVYGKSGGANFYKIKQVIGDPA